MHAHTCTHVRRCVRACVGVCMHAGVCVRACVRECVFAYVRACVRTCVCRHKYACICMCVYDLWHGGYTVNSYFQEELCCSIIIETPLLVSEHEL